MNSVKGINKRYIAVDMVKLLFAVVIMLHHIFLQYNISNEISQSIKYLIALAVPYFFAVSGFFFFEKIYYGNNDIKKVTISNIKKIMCMYSVWSLTIIVIKLPAMITNCQSIKSLLVLLVKEVRIFLLIGEYQLWYLVGLIYVLVMFYIFYRKRKLRYCIVVAVVCSIIRLVCTYNVNIFATQNIISKLYNGYMIVFGTFRNGIFVGFTYFIIGCILSKYKCKITNKMYPLKILALLLIGGLSFIYQYNNANILSEILEMLVVVCILYCVLCVTRDKNAKLCRDLSSIIYVSHVTMILIVQTLFKVNVISMIAIVAVVDILFAIVIMEMSKRFKLLKNIY